MNVATRTTSTIMNHPDFYVAPAGSPYAEENSLDELEAGNRTRHTNLPPSIRSQAYPSIIPGLTHPDNISEQRSSSDTKVDKSRDTADPASGWHDVAIGPPSTATTAALNGNTVHAPPTRLATASSTPWHSYRSSSDTTLFALPPPALDPMQPVCERSEAPYWKRIFGFTRRPNSPADRLFSVYVPGRRSRWSLRRPLGGSDSHQDLPTYARNQDGFWSRLWDNPYTTRVLVGFVVAFMIFAVVMWAIGSGAKKRLQKRRSGI